MAGSKVLDVIRNATPWVHVERPDAIPAFAQGRFVFDVTQDGKLIDAFISKLKSELGIVVVRPSPVYLPNLPGVSIYLVHLDRMPKPKVANPPLRVNGADRLAARKTV